MALTAQALTDLDTLKAELAISSSGEDAYLERLIERASARIVSLCGGRLFHYETGIIERAAGYGTALISLKRRPILSVASVALNDTLVSSDDYRIEDAGAGLLSRIGGLWANTSLAWGVESEAVAGTELGDYLVTYTGGYVTPNQATELLPRTLPYDIEEAALALAVLGYRQRGRDLSVRSRELLSGSISYDTRGVMPECVTSIISRYSEVLL